VTTFYEPAGERGSLVPPLLVLGSVAALAGAVVNGQGVRIAAAAVVAVSLLAVSYRVLVRWPTLVGAIGLIILLIPIKRYGFSGVSLPLDLEPYRVAVAFVVLLWFSSALIDSRVTFRRSGLETPLFLFLVAVLGSVLTNFGRISSLDLSAEVAKELLFLVSFVLFFYFIVSVIRTPEAIHTVLKIFVAGTAIVALFALVERRTGYNVFNHLHPILPLLDFRGGLSDEGIARAGRLRTYASAQHPIALAGLLVMMIPFSVYLARHTRRWIWAAAAVLILFGALATVSRTSITMLAAVAAVFLWLRPRDLKRLVPLLVPALIVVHIALPGVIGGIRQAFFPPEGLVADQTEYGGRLSGRRLGPQFDAIGEQPAFGQGLGTRQTTGPKTNARILDNQWLGTAVETGLVGMLAWVWIFGRFIRRTGRASKDDDSERGWLLAAFAASATAFAVGMFTFDAFSFIQVTFALFIVLALGVSTLAWEGPWPAARHRRWLRTSTEHS
jgi:O-antigen ligase